MRLRAMVWSFVPGGPPKDLGRRVIKAARFAAGIAGMGAAVAATVAIVVVVEGPAAVVNTLMDAAKEGGRD